MNDPRMDPAIYAATVAEDEDEISLLDLLQTVADHFKLLLIGPILAGLAALGIAYAIPPTYTARTVFLPPQQQQSAAAAALQSLGALGGLAGAAGGMRSPVDQYVAFMKSRGIQDALVERFKLMPPEPNATREDARLALAASSRIAGGKDGLISVEVDHRDAAVAAQLANGYVEELGKLLNRLAVTEAQQRRLFFQKQLDTTKARLVQAETALQSTGVGIGTLKAQPQAAVEALARLQAEIVAQEIKVASMRGYLTETAPDFRQALNELSALRAQLAKLERNSSAGAATAVGGNADYIARYREFKYHETLFELFSRQYEMARVDESREGAVVQVLDPAQAPDRKSKPNKALIAVVAALAAGFALLVFVFARQALRHASQDPASAAKIQAIRRSLGLKPA